MVVHNYGFLSQLIKSNTIQQKVYIVCFFSYDKKKDGIRKISDGHWKASKSTSAKYVYRAESSACDDCGRFIGLVACLSFNSINIFRMVWHDFVWHYRIDSTSFLFMGFRLVV